jgi:hypothetical protein
MGKPPVLLVCVVVLSFARTSSPEFATVKIRPAEPYIAVIALKVASLLSLSLPRCALRHDVVHTLN